MQIAENTMERLVAAVCILAAVFFIFCGKG